MWGDPARGSCQCADISTFLSLWEMRWLLMWSAAQHASVCSSTVLRPFGPHVCQCCSLPGMPTAVCSAAPLHGAAHASSQHAQVLLCRLLLMPQAGCAVALCCNLLQAYLSMLQPAWDANSSLQHCTAAWCGACQQPACTGAALQAAVDASGRLCSGDAMQSALTGMFVSVLACLERQLHSEALHLWMVWRIPAASMHRWCSASFC